MRLHLHLHLRLLLFQADLVYLCTLPSCLWLGPGMYHTHCTVRGTSTGLVGRWATAPEPSFAFPGYTQGPMGLLF